MTKIDAKEAGLSAVRSLFSIVPFAGQALNEVTFEYRSRVKQNRLNRFTELLSDFFAANGENVDLESIKTEDFSDLMESVLIRVMKTKSEEKHKRFRDVLVNKIQNPQTDTDHSEVYLDLISTLSEIEIKILYHHQVFNKDFEKEKIALDKLRHDLLQKQEKQKKETELVQKGFANNSGKLISEIPILEKEIALQTEKLGTFQKYREHGFYQLTSDQFLYYKQNLYAKGLLIDSGVGAIGIRPFQIMSITQFGKEFISFIIKS